MSWRVVITGSECTGKTTLARDIAARLGAPWVAESSRAYAAARGGVLSAADVEPIARVTIAAQQAAQHAAQDAGAATIVFDTDLVSTLVYARSYYGECPAWIEEECREHLADLYLLCAPDIPWVADGIRDRPSSADRAAMHHAFADTLQAMGAHVVIVTGAGDDRLDVALHALHAVHAVHAVHAARPLEAPAR